MNTTGEPITRYWWLWLLEGIVLILIGWWLLAQPITSTLILVQILALYWFVTGIITIVRAIVDTETTRRGWMFLGGLLGMLAGWWIVNNALFAGVITPTVFLWTIAIIFIINGGVKIFFGNVKNGGKRQPSWGAFAAGIFYCIMGFALMVMPLVTGLTILVFSIGVLAIIGGIGMIVYSFQIRKMK